MSSFVTLPEDTISEILLRLPVESLQRFKCVSKSCLNEEDESFAQIVGPCNGMFCVFNAKDGVISLWNPANRHLKNLPKSSVKPPLDAHTFDLCIGFGFDDENNEYKVLAFKHMCLPSASTVVHAELYTLRTNKWKEIDVGEEFQPTGNLPYSPSNPSLDGIFSWFEVDNHVEKVIFSFNMKNEVFIKTQLPCYDGIPSKGIHGCLASLKNSLAFIHDFLLARLSRSFDVWVLGEYGVRESWVKLLTIGPKLGVAAPLGLWKNGELLLKHDERILVSYDPTTQDMKDLQIPRFIDILQVLPYKKSLVCLTEAEEGFDQNTDEFPFSVSECNEENSLQIPSSSNS